MQKVVLNRRVVEDFMNEHDVQQRELAALAGIAPGTLGGALSGGAFNTHTLAAIAGVIGVNPGVLVVWEGAGDDGAAEETEEGEEGE